MCIEDTKLEAVKFKITRLKGRQRTAYIITPTLLTMIRKNDLCVIFAL